MGRRSQPQRRAGPARATRVAGDDDEPGDQNEYLVSLVGKQSTTQIVILDTDGKREQSETADRILGLLHEQLK